MLTDLQRRKLTRYFTLFDVDDDGRIGPRDFSRVIENLRILHGVAVGSARHDRISEDFMVRWTGIRRSADADADGTVDLQEWFGYWSALLTSEERYAEEVVAVSRRLMALFDVDEDGTIGPDEFCDLYGVFGLRSALARQIFLDLDEDGDGSISLDEMSRMVDQFYRSDDPDAPGNRLYGPY